MRLFATGLLVLMAGLFVGAKSMEAAEPAGAVWPWLRAFAEAAVVGALADWFAVTALFRHPLGLPIPHTAIVKKEKERIGAAVASFVRKSFLTPKEVTRQWLNWCPLEKLACRFAQPQEAKKSLSWVIAQLPSWLSSTDRKALASFGASGIQNGASAIPFGKVVAVALRGFLGSPDRRQFLSPLLTRLSRSVADNRKWVMDEASKSAKPQKLKILDLLSQTATSVVSGKAVSKFASELEAAGQDESHPLYEKIEEVLAETLEEIEAGGAEGWDALKERILGHPETSATLKELIESTLTIITNSPQSAGSEERVEVWSQALSGAAQRLLEDEERLAVWEKRASEMVARFSGRYGDQIEKLITQTVATWKAEELIERIENQVGADLQFIRINGTLIGGLVGLTLHGVGLLIWG